MAIILEPKGITTESKPKYENHTQDGLLPLGEKPEGELHALERMQNAFNKLMSTIKLLEGSIKKLTEENKRLKDALGITEVEEPLVLTEDMEVKNDR